MFSSLDRQSGTYLRPLEYRQVQLIKEHQMESFLYTVQEAAETLKMSRSKVYGLIKEGVLHSVKIGGSRRLRRQDIAQFVESLGTTHETQYQDIKG